MYLAEPKDFERGLSEVFITFEQALEIIRAIDAMTQGIRKIVYLVGWQGLGHDDCYPAMDVVNDALKRGCDATGKESLRRSTHSEGKHCGCDDNKVLADGRIIESPENQPPD